MSPADRELEHISRGGIRPLSGGLSLMFLAGTPGIVVMLPPGPAMVIAAVTAATIGALMGGLWMVLGTRQIPRESGHAAACGILLIVAGYLTLRGHLQPGPQQTTNIMLLVVGAGALILSTRWYTLAVAVALAAWASFAIPSWGTDSGMYAFGLVNASLLSSVIHVTRRRAMLGLIQAQAEVAELALKDDLTGLRNRRGLIEIGGEHVAAARRAGRASTILFVDVDGLKRINDSFGHAAGDTALRRVAAALQAAFREADLIARLGGDEFVVLLPDKEVFVDAIVARLDEALADARDSIRGVPLTVSVGRAVIEPNADEDLPTALDRADAAMYERRVGRFRRAG